MIVFGGFPPALQDDAFIFLHSGIRVPGDSGALRTGRLPSCKSRVGFGEGGTGDRLCGGEEKLAEGGLMVWARLPVYAHESP